MPGRIEEIAVLEVICDLCGSLSAPRPRPLRDAENELVAHDYAEHPDEAEDA